MPEVDTPPLDVAVRWVAKAGASVAEGLEQDLSEAFAKGGNAVEFSSLTPSVREISASPGGTATHDHGVASSDRALNLENCPALTSVDVSEAYLQVSSGQVDDANRYVGATQHDMSYNVSNATVPVGDLAGPEKEQETASSESSSWQSNRSAAYYRHRS